MATDASTDKRLRQLQEDVNAAREDNRRLRADLDVLRSGRLGTLGFKTGALVGDNALATAKYKDASVTAAKLAANLPRTSLLTRETALVDVDDGAGFEFSKWRLTDLGIQILADDDHLLPPVFLIVPSYVDDLAYSGGAPRPDVDYWSGLFGNADNTDNYIELISRNYTGDLTTWFASVIAYADNGNALVELKAQNSAGAIAEIQVTAYPTASSSVGIAGLTNAVLLLMLATADPTGTALIDGMMLYRSDTDVYRGRENGVTVTFITTGSASWTDLTDGTATTLHSHAGAGMATDTLWDAKGDLAAGTAADTGARLAKGAEKSILMVDTGTATDLRWVGVGIPSDQALGDTAAAGTAALDYAGTGHKHGMPAAATQAEQETGTSVLVPVTPGRQQFHPSAAKVWVQGTPNSTTIITSYNVASLGDTNTGQQTVTIGVDFSSGSYCVQVTIGDAGTTLAQSGTVMTKAAGSYIMNSVIEGGSGDDPSADWNSVGFGDQ